MAEEQNNTGMEQSTASVQGHSDELDLFGEFVPEAALKGEMDHSEEPYEDRNSGDGQGNDAETPPPSDQTPESPNGKNTETDPASDDGAKANRPPKGFVPHEALQEERAKRKAAQRQLEELQKRLEAGREQEAGEASVALPEDTSEEVRDFVRKYPKYAPLILENSPDGARLRDKLDTYGEDEAADFARTLRVERELDAKKQRSEAEKNMDFAMSCVREMDRLFDGGLQGKEATDLVAHLQQAGLEPDTITLLTSPNTEIIDPRNGKRMPLGSRVLELVGYFRDAFRMQQASDPEAMKAAIRKEVETEVGRTMMEKIRSGTSFRDIGTAPGTEETPAGIPVTEEAFARLSPAEQERLLMGL